VASGLSGYFGTALTSADAALSPREFSAVIR
jgi:hypothetical protein